MSFTARFLVLLALLAIGVQRADAHGATAPPVGALPSGPTAKVHMKKGQIVTFALPRGVHGKAWRIKGSVNGTILHEVSETDRATHVDIVFKAVGRGLAIVRFGLTQGEHPTAYRARRYAIRVR
jgi:hypothetical protein